MSQNAVRLIPLMCVKCQAPIAAKAEEVAWVCQQCGQGLILDSAPAGKSAACAQDVFFSAAIPPGKSGRPFWVSSGRVTITRRETYKGNESRSAQEFWSAARLFYIPGWDAALEDIVSNGVQLLKTPRNSNSERNSNSDFAMQSGSPAPFLPVVTLPVDMKALAEFMVVSIEAGRNDALKHIEFDLELASPQLWVLP